MRDELTNAERRVLGALAYLTDERGTPPSLRELADFLSIYTDATLTGLLQDLRVRGFAADVLYGEQSSGDNPVAAEHLSCSECQDESDEQARGWQALIVSDDDGDPDVMHICPGCAVERSSTSGRAQRRQTYGQEVSRGRRNRRGSFSQVADEVLSLGNRRPLSSLPESVELFMDLLAVMPADACDPEWDWPSVCLLADGDDGLFFAPAQIPAGAERQQWFNHLMSEEFPSLLDQIERRHIGLMLNVSNHDGREFLILFTTDACEADAWISEIDRRADGMRYLVGWNNRPELRTGRWWDYIEGCRRVLAQVNAAH